MYCPERNICALDGAPKYSFGVKSQIEKPNDTPAPDAYKIERSNTIILYHRSPKYTFGIRPADERPNDTPGMTLFISWSKVLKY